MHLYALDEQENLITAHQAEKKVDYRCRECHGVVRCRGGFLRQMHFYHLEPNRHCRQSGKTILHLQSQNYMQRILPECELEKNFPSIKRIADVAWEKEKLIFEIQCSAITAREIEERNRDYQSLGYQVIWILHDHLYNKNRLTAAEYFLQEFPHYFTNINAEGIGRIYDQNDLVEKGKRIKTMEACEVQISSYRFLPKDCLTAREFPKGLHKRAESWPLYFLGDHLDNFLRTEEPSSAIENIVTVPEVVINKPQSWLRKKLKKFFHLITFPYRLTFYLIMDRLTR